MSFFTKVLFSLFALCFLTTSSLYAAITAVVTEGKCRGQTHTIGAEFTLQNWQWNASTSPITITFTITELDTNTPIHSETLVYADDYDAANDVTTADGTLVKTCGGAACYPSFNLSHYRTVSAAGRYEFELTGTGFTTETSVVTVTTDAANLPFVTIGSVTTSPTSTCHGEGSITIIATNATRYYIKPPGDDFSPAELNSTGTHNFRGLSTGIYNILAENDDGCSATTSEAVNTASELKFTSISSENGGVGCSPPTSSNGEIRLEAQGGTTPYSYVLNGGTAVNFSGSNTEDTIPSRPSGTVILSLVDASNCFSDPTSYNHLLNNPFDASAEVQAGCISSRQDGSAHPMPEDTTEHLFHILSAEGGSGNLKYRFIEGLIRQTNTL